MIRLPLAGAVLFLGLLLLGGGHAEAACASTNECSSKINGYAVLQEVGVGASKINGYAVLCCAGIGSSKINGYAILSPGAATNGLMFKSGPGW